MEAVSPREVVSAKRASLDAPGAPALDFDGFYSREFPAMSALAHTVCGDRSWAEDIAQEALSRAHQHWPKISGYDRPGAWLRRVTINLALSRRDRRRREVVGLSRAHHLTQGAARAGVSEPDDDIWQAVAQLAPRQRAVVALFYQDDLATDAIAEILECSVSTVTSHLAAARRRLADILDEDVAHDAAPPASAPLNYHVVATAKKVNQ